MNAEPDDLTRVIRAQVEAVLAGPRPAPIVQAGDPVLRLPAAPLTDQIDDETLAELIEVMREAMYAAPGVGVAAPQIGVGLKIAVLEDPGMGDADVADVRERTPFGFRVIINPSYEPVAADGSDVPEKVAFYEGCLSVDGFQAVRARWRAVRLTCQDESGEEISEVLQGWPARILQHETDHLYGELYIDKSELRSLTSSANLERFWLRPDPSLASKILGFPVP